MLQLTIKINTYKLQLIVISKYKVGLIPYENLSFRGKLPSIQKIPSNLTINYIVQLHLKI